MNLQNALQQPIDLTVGNIESDSHPKFDENVKLKTGVFIQSKCCFLNNGCLILKNIWSICLRV